MLSAMSTSENFSLKSQPRCPSSPYRSVTRSAYGSSMRDECREILLDGTFSAVFDKPNDRFEPSYPAMRDYSNTIGQIDVKMMPDVCETLATNNGSVVNEEVPKLELESDINELLEELDLEDISYDQSKPLKLDTNGLKLNFYSAANDFGLGENSETNYKFLDEFCMRIARENKRASHHLSGGGLLSDSCQGTLQNLADVSSKSSVCRMQDGGCISMENIFVFDDLDYFATREKEEYKQSNFLNQISPSSPLTFDLAAPSELKNITKGNATSAESTNPFNNIFLKDALDSENPFSSTNPFTSPNFRSSPDELPNPSPDYENLSIPQKSFSQCSTRPASPASSKSGPEEPCISNPFLLNQASPQSCPSLNVAQFVLNDGRSQQSAIPTTPSSFIFAFPVFPIIQHQIANSSTQTGDVPETNHHVEEPVYQNVTNQLKKFMQWNNHSEYDLQCLKTTMKDLRNSGWYYENVSWQESVILLKDTEPGTFLIRDSSDPNFLFSLSVQTSRGPTSVRLHYVNRQFRLDAEEKLIPHMPSFNSVIELIDYYIENTVKNRFSNSHFKKSAKKNGRDKLQMSKEQVWIDAQGNVYSNILLVKPLHKKEHFSSLQHLTRLAINRHIKKSVNSRCKFNFRVTPVYESSPFQDSSFPASFDSFCPILNVDNLPLPITLTNYLKDYPYCH